jgi:hypothetical protein
MKCFLSISYRALTRWFLASALTITSTPGALAQDWKAAIDTASSAAALKDWPAGYPVETAQAIGGTDGQMEDPVADDAVALPAIPVTAEGDEDPTQPIKGYVAKEEMTATKTDTPIMETPQGISVITRDQMDAQNVNDIGDVLRYTAGGNSEPYGTDKRGLFFNLRGFNGQDDSFYRDGLQLRGSLFAGFTRSPPPGGPMTGRAIQASPPRMPAWEIRAAQTSYECGTAAKYPHAA